MAVGVMWTCVASDDFEFLQQQRRSDQTRFENQQIDFESNEIAAFF